MLISRHQEYLCNLPNGWEQVPIEQLGTIYAGGTPSRLEPSFWNGSIAWVTPGELTGLDGKWLAETREYITKPGLAGSSAHLMPKGTLLITTRATIGAVAVAAIPVCTNQGFKSIVPNELTNSDFYYHLLQQVAPELFRLASGSTFDEISRRDFATIVVPRPSRDEQRRIAEILDTLDEAIARTESLIAKLKQMKAGLLHDLLTRGLDENGELRDAIAHPEQFKDSPLGLIPKEWQVRQLKQVAKKISDGEHLSPVFLNEGVPILSAKDVRENSLDFLTIRYISEQAAKLALARCDPQRGDILVVSRGATIGRIHFVTTERQFALMGSVIQIRPDSTLLNGQYLSFFLGLEQSQAELLRTSGSSAQQAIYLAHIQNMYLPLPTLAEQECIANIINAHNTRIRKEEAYRDKLKLQKKGLMHDLLTGGVRVEVKKINKFRDCI